MNRLRKVFKRIRYLLAAMAAGTALWGFAPEARAMDEIMPLEEVEAGMTGELFTVADASGEIRSFEVTILGVMRNGKSMPYIIARSEGAFADTDGGLMQGMSGSPVYVDGRLVGAGSATVKEMDPHTFLVTPIEEMLPLWDMPDTKNQTRPRLVDLKKTAEEKAKEEGKDAKAEENGQKTETDKAGKDAKGKEEPKDEAKKPAASVKDTETKKETPAEPKKEPEAQKEKEAAPAKEPEVKKEAQNADKQETKKDERPKLDTRKKAEAENREEDED